MANLFDLTGKVAVVTGASTGLGVGMAAALANAGADIVGVARGSCAELGAVVRASGRVFLEINADLSELKAIPTIVDTAVKELGRIDILLNNAGIVSRNACVDYTEDDWDNTMNLNLKSLFFLSQAVGKLMLAQAQGGKIINIASVLSFQGGVVVPAYAASKGAVRTITQSLSNEWAQKGINVNAIAPGYMKTTKTKAIQDDEVRNRQVLERIPAGRWGTPEDLGGAVVFLASKASDYVNGITLAVDGGWLGR